MIDWQEWHDAYDRPGSELAQRLAAVREQVAAALNAAPPGPVRVLSLCAGQGRDLLEALPGHPRRDDVRGVLVELDPRNAATARRAAAPFAVEVREADAALVDGYADAAPADVLLLCGVFGNISDDDIARTVAAAASLTAAGGTVLWTRTREAPDLFPRVCAWFAEAGFEPVFLSPPEAPYGLGVHRRPGPPAAALPAGARLFAFVR